jgi:hypothetical protein
LTVEQEFSNPKNSFDKKYNCESKNTKGIDTRVKQERCLK